MDPLVKGKRGWTELIVGPMFSGKSEELIRRLRRAEIARKKVEIFKPAIDDRYATDVIVSHAGLEMACTAVRDAEQILDKVDRPTEVVGIDEAQFLGNRLVAVCQKLAEADKRVIVAGLEVDYRGRPFEPMPALVPGAAKITKLLAICERCGNPAAYTQRLVASRERILVGAKGIYQARCRRCFQPHLAQHWHQAAAAKATA